MQKINFLPEVKLWNGAEFGSRQIWLNPSLGEMTYDGVLNKFAVVLQGKNNPEWKYLLTSDSSTEHAATTLRLYQGNDAYTDIPASEEGLITVLTESAYNSASNKLATMADVQGAVAGASLLGVKMDTSILSIDSSYVMVYSDPSSKYCDNGTPSSSDYNPLATVGTVKKAVTDAIASLGDVFELRGVYTDASGGTVNGVNVPAGSADTFGRLLNYLSNNSGLTGLDKGSVIVYENLEYVLLDPNNAGSTASWELLGSIDSNTCVVSLGSQSGVITISDSFYMNSRQLNLNVANDNSIGGIKTGYTETVTDSSTKYNFAVRVDDGTVGDVANANTAYVSIPIVSGGANDASYGLVSNDALKGSTYIYTVNIDPSTCTGVTYGNIKSVQIAHNIGSSDLLISVYKLSAGAAERNSRQLVYVDEIIASDTNIVIDFGSAAAFVGCQDKNQQDAYLGYVVVICASTQPRDPGATITPTVEPVVVDNNG